NSVNETGGVDRRSGTAAPVLEMPTEEQQRKIAAQEKVVAALDAKVKPINAKLLAGLPAWEKTVKEDTLPDPVRVALKVGKAKRTPEQSKALSDHYLNTFPVRQSVQKELDKSKKALA